MNRDDDYDSDEERRREESLPKFRIRHNDMPIKEMKEIVVCKNIDLKISMREIILN
jgi:hypothetical protein